MEDVGNKLNNKFSMDVVLGKNIVFFIWIIQSLATLW